MSEHMMVSGFTAVLAIFGILLAVAALLFWIWMLVDAVQKEEGASKIAWVLIILFLHFLGALIYFFVRKLPR